MRSAPKEGPVSSSVISGTLWSLACFHAVIGGTSKRAGCCKAICSVDCCEAGRWQCSGLLFPLEWTCFLVLAWFCWLESWLVWTWMMWPGTATTSINASSTSVSPILATTSTSVRPKAPPAQGLLNLQHAPHHFPVSFTGSCFKWASTACCVPWGWAFSPCLLF